MSLATGVDLGCVFDGRPVTPSFFERARGRWTGLGGFTHWSLLSRAGRTDGTPRFLVRVDDYPRWDLAPDVFARFHGILRAASIRYVLGVIPSPTDPHAKTERGRQWTPAERAGLEAARPDLDVAMHGLTHRAKPGPVPMEIVDRKPIDLERDLDEGLRRLETLGYHPRSYIPPFNAVDHPALAVLATRFAAVHAGPETVRWLGCVPGPCRLDGIWFLPSYAPAYGRARDVLRFVVAAREQRAPLLVPVTLHWAWEASDGFEDVKRLAGALAGHTVTFEEWEAGTSWRS